MAQQVKNPALSLLRLGCDPWPGNVHVPWAWLKKTKSLSEFRYYVIREKE